MRIFSTNALAGRVLISVLARDIENARQVWEASEGCCLIGVALKDYDTADEARSLCHAIRTEFGLLSLNLGGGDSSQWQKIIHLALETDPGHVNQVFPALGYTLLALHSKGLTDNVVNAVTYLAPEIGNVVISTGPLSSLGPPASVPVESAARMIREVGGISLKVLGACGEDPKRLTEIVKQAGNQGIQIFEPAGGITMENVLDVVNACLIGNNMLIIPHIHTAVIDRVTKRTDPQKVATVVRCLSSALG